MNLIDLSSYKNLIPKPHDSGGVISDKRGSNDGKLGLKFIV